MKTFSSPGVLAYSLVILTEVMRFFVNPVSYSVARLPVCECLGTHHRGSETIVLPARSTITDGGAPPSLSNFVVKSTGLILTF